MVKLSDTQVADILTLQNQLDYVKKQMEEEKEKLQNLQFTNEEQNVANIELQNKNSELLIKIKELEIDLNKERNITKDVEKETMKIFEKEEELCRIKEELESLKKVIDNNEDELQKSVSNLSSEVVDKEVLLNTLRQTLNENTQTHDRLLKEANEKLHATSDNLNKIIEEKNKKLEQNQEMIDQLNEGIKCLSALKNEEHDGIVHNLKNELSKLKDEYKSNIDKKEHSIQISLEKHIQIEDKLKQELKYVLENKNQEIEQLQQNYNNLIELNSSAKDDIDKLKLKLQITTRDLEDLKAKNLVYSKEALDVVLKQQIHSMFTNVEDLKRQFDKSITFKDKQIDTCNKTLLQIKEQIIKSKSCLEMTFNDKIKEKENKNKILLEKLNTITHKFEQLEKDNLKVNQELKTALKSIQDKTTLIADLEKKYNNLEFQQNLNKNELEKELTTKLKYVNDELTLLKLEKSALEKKYDDFVKEKENTIIDMDNKLKQNNILIENLNKSFKELTSSKQKEVDSMNKQIIEVQKEREQLLKHQNVELSTKDEIINTLTNKLEKTLSEKQKQDLSNANLQTELTNESTKYETALKDLQNKIDELEVKIESNNEIFKKELELSSNEKESIKLENINLLEKLKSLEHSKINLEDKLMSNEISKQNFKELNEVLEEKQKHIDDNQIKFKQFDDLIIQMKNEYVVMLKDKEEEINKLTKIAEENIKIKKFSLEEKTKSILDEKDKDNLILHQKINDLENMKRNFEEQLKEKELQEQSLKKLNESMQENIQVIKDKNVQIDQLNDLILLTKHEYELKLLDKENEINELSKIEVEKLNSKMKQLEEQNKAIMDEKDKENSNLLEKIIILENTKASLEKQLEINKTQEGIILELKTLIEEKTKIINDNNLTIDQLNNTITASKDEFSVMLKEKDDKINECKETEKQKLYVEMIQKEKNIKNLLDEKDKENSNLLKKLNALEKTKLNLEEQLEFSKKLEYDIKELKKIIDEKTQIIDNNNLNIEQLNKFNMQTKEDFDMKLQEKENKIDELLKIREEKLIAEKIAFETSITTCLKEKDTEIDLLKKKLQEYVDNNTEKELMLKLETVVNTLEKEKTRVSSLEKLKSELEKTVLEHKSELEASKMYEEQQCINVELIAKIETESEKLKIEKSQIQKQFDELKIKFSLLQSTLDEKNCEIECIKSQTYQEKITNSSSEELDRLKVLL